VCFAGFGLEFARGSKPNEVVSGHIEKNMSTPDWGMRADPFVATIQARLGKNSHSHLISTRKRIGGSSWSPSRQVVLRVLVNYALNLFDLTNQFLRFPRVRQQTRGNFSLQYH
jgi:hypothetical protein